MSTTTHSLATIAMFTQPPMWEWTPKPNNYTTPLPAIAMDNLASFNINNDVHVRLTATGRFVLHSQKIKIPAEDQSGYSRWQLWELMNTFGPHLWNGAPVPFEPTIKLALD